MSFPRIVVRTATKPFRCRLCDEWASAGDEMVQDPEYGLVHRECYEDSYSEDDHYMPQQDRGH